MNKQILMDYLSEADFVVTDKEHRRGNSFYVDIAYILEPEDVESLKEMGVVLPDGENYGLTGSGTWDDDWGVELNTVELMIVRQRVIPETIVHVPAHDVVTPEKTVTDWIEYKEKE